MKTLAIFLFILIGFTALNLRAQDVPLPKTTDSVVRALKPNRLVKDSAYYARQKFVTDSIIRHTWILPDSLLSSTMIMDSIMNRAFGEASKEPWYTIHDKGKKESLYKKGKLLPKGNTWVLTFIVFLLVVFGVLKIYFSRQLYTMVQAFFSNRVLNNLYKEDNLFTSWPFLLLFVQFGFTIGMFFYLVTQYYQVSYGTSPIQFYLTISVMIIILYTLKIVLLKLLGHIFNIQKPVHEYIIILYLSYFNLSLLFIPLVIAFALTSMKYGLNYIFISLAIAGIIFTFQVFRAGINVLSHYRFSKIYLFLYFCALEICPILILIKAVGL